MNRPPKPPPLERRLMPRLHHLGGFTLMMALLAASLFNPFRVRRSVAAETPTCKVELTYPQRAVFSQNESIEARVTTDAACGEPRLELDSDYLRRFSQLNVLTIKSAKAGAESAREGRPLLYDLRMEMVASRSLFARGSVHVRCEDRPCASFPISTFVFP